VEEDEVETLRYPMDILYSLFNPPDFGLHKISANLILHQEIFATFCIGGVSN